MQLQLILEQIRHALLALELDQTQRAFAEDLALRHVDPAVLEQQRLFDQLDRAAGDRIQWQVHAAALLSKRSNASTMKRTGRSVRRPSHAVWPRRSPEPPLRHGSNRSEGGPV